MFFLVMGKRELNALLCLPYWYFVTVIFMWPSLSRMWVGLLLVIVVFTGDKHLFLLLIFVCCFVLKNLVLMYKISGWGINHVFYVDTLH